MIADIYIPFSICYQASEFLVPLMNTLKNEVFHNFTTSRYFYYGDDSNYFGFNLSYNVPFLKEPCQVFIYIFDHSLHIKLKCDGKIYVYASLLVNFLKKQFPEYLYNENLYVYFYTNQDSEFIPKIPRYR